MRQPAARLGDPTDHEGCFIITGFDDVLIGGQPAARVGDTQTCPLVTEAGVPHVGGDITTGSATVFIGGANAARVGDLCSCTMGPDAPPGTPGIPNTIASGLESVEIG
jgi:uncharacterized Zn-binding protein involved in type VI secretion